MPSLESYLMVSTLLFGLGAFGFMARRNAILMLISIELMLNAVNLSLVAFNAFQPAEITGAAFALMIMAVAAAEATVGLALVIAIIRTRQTPEVDEYADLKE
jgi:NADH-quinone oxidoreductase subunit K